MTLLEEIQNAAVDSHSDLGAILRKCKVLAARLGSKPLEDWLIWESNGYPEKVELPKYRVWKIELKGNFFGPGGQRLRAPIPSVSIPEEYRDKIINHHCRECIASIENLVKNKKSHSGILYITMGDLPIMLGQNVYNGHNCIQAWGEVGTGQLIEVLNAVRNRILDFVLALWKENPNAGNAQEDTAKLQSSKVTQIFNTTIYGGNASLIGTVNNSLLNVNIQTNNFTTLRNYFKTIGISEEDIGQLKQALEKDVVPSDVSSLGSHVSTWIAKMLDKAASGAWKIASGAAGSLLAQAISKYYGLT